MGLEWHNRRRRKDGTFLPETWDEDGPLLVDVHLMMTRETAKELRRRAPRARQSLGEYTEGILKDAWKREEG